MALSARVQSLPEASPYNPQLDFQKRTFNLETKKKSTSSLQK